MIVSAEGVAAPIILDRDAGVRVRRVAGDLRRDIAMIDGAVDYRELQHVFKDVEACEGELLDAAAAKGRWVPRIVDTEETDGVQAEVIDYAIIVGDLRSSGLLAGIAERGELPEAQSVAGMREAFAIGEVDDPIPGVRRALVIAGSDDRGTVYGVYEVSKRLGVSPWWWMSDAPVRTMALRGLDALAWTDGTVVGHEPSVRWRGIFINDEENLREWAFRKYGYPDTVSSPDCQLRIFEMIMRLKGNVFWPAMHEYTAAFNAVTGSDGERLADPALADRFGLIIGTSHCEMMMRNNVGEWAQWYEAHRSDAKYGPGGIVGDTSRDAYDYTVNKRAILDYWEEAVADHRAYESFYELGIRGVHDGAPAMTHLDEFLVGSGPNALNPAIHVEGEGLEAKEAALLKDVIYEQRRILARHYGSESDALQVFVPYKEMHQIYLGNGGDLKRWIAANAPDAVLMWANDNYGYVRQAPDEGEKAEGRMNGIYYHNSYWGVPDSYLWLNSHQIQLMDEEMHRAFRDGSKDYWILNVGKIKPGEVSIEYFLDMAWDVERYSGNEAIVQFFEDVAARDYLADATTAKEIARCWNEYHRYQGHKRAEHYRGNYGIPVRYSFSTYANGDEAIRWVNMWDSLYSRMDAIWRSLPEAGRDVFYEHMLHAVRCARDFAVAHCYWRKNLQAAEQGRYVSAQRYRDLSLDAIEDVQVEQDYSWSMNDGKWYAQANYRHEPKGRVGKDGSHWVWHNEDQSRKLLAPRDFAEAAEGHGVGVCADGSDRPGDATLHFSSLSRDVHYFDVFGRGGDPADWIVEAADWIRLSGPDGHPVVAGTVLGEMRIEVRVDWEVLGASVRGTNALGEIRVYNADYAHQKSGAAVATLYVTAVVEYDRLAERNRAYQAVNGYAMIEAEHWSRLVPGADGSEWTVVDGLAQRGGCLQLVGAKGQLRFDKDPTLLAATARAEYDVWFPETGMYQGYAFRVPMLDEASLRCATGIGLDGGEPVMLEGNAHADNVFDSRWANNVEHEIEMIPFAVQIREIGWHTVGLYGSSPAMAFDRIVIARPGALASMNGFNGGLDSRDPRMIADIAIGPAVSPNNFINSGELAGFQLNEIGRLPEEVTEGSVFNAHRWFR